MKYKSKIKPKGIVFAKFYASNKKVRIQSCIDDSEWITIANCRTAKQAQILAEILNKPLEEMTNVPTIYKESSKQDAKLQAERPAFIQGCLFSSSEPCG